MADPRRYALYPSLVERVVVISGGATGIGASMVEEFARQGSRVIILDILQDEASELIEGLKGLDVVNVPVFHLCDLTDIDGAVKPIAKKILAKYPKIHAVINNAANDVRRPTLDLTVEQWDDGMAVNLRHQFFLTQALMPGLVAAGSSSVINMGSITWARGGHSLIPYVASKSAIVGLTKALAREFGPRGVRVNSIMPGAIATERQRRDVLTPETEEEVIDSQALKRLLVPEDVARMALWLVADDGSGVTNQSLVVDAGWLH